MTNELKAKLMEHHKEELMGHDTYRTLADEAEKEGMHHAHGVLCDIANEEETHAKLLQHILSSEEAK